MARVHTNRLVNQPPPGGDAIVGCEGAQGKDGHHLDDGRGQPALVVARSVIVRHDNLHAVPSAQRRHQLGPEPEQPVPVCYYDPVDLAAADQRQQALAGHACGNSGHARDPG